MASPTFAKLPTHIAIIMDGNGRWAKQRLLPRTAGHAAGVETFHEIVRECSNLGIQYTTVYAFSTENWNRDVSEVTALIHLLEQAIVKFRKELKEKNVKLRVMGDLSRFPESSRNAIQSVVNELSDDTGMELSLCLSYGGRQEIVRAVNELMAEGKTEITDLDISNHLYSRGIPDPDLIIRTSGEYRISNFLLWQSAYSEYYFVDTYWPDFHAEDLYKAIEAYGKRSRRFGKEK